MPGIGKTRSRGLRKVSGGRLGQRGVEAPETAGASATLTIVVLAGLAREFGQDERLAAAGDAQDRRGHVERVLRSAVDLERRPVPRLQNVRS